MVPDPWLASARNSVIACWRLAKRGRKLRRRSGTTNRAWVELSWSAFGLLRVRLSQVGRRSRLVKGVGSRVEFMT